MTTTNLGQLRTIGGEQLRVNVTNPGPTQVAIVFVNGMGVSLDYWEPVVELLPEFTCIRFDRPGMGGSPDSGWDSTDIRTEVDRIFRVADDQVGPRCQIVLVGHSYGGIIAETAARLEPQRTVGLVLVDGTDPLQHADDDTRLEAVLAPAFALASSIPGFASTVGGAVERIATFATTVNPDGPRLTPEQRSLVSSRTHVRNLLREDLRIPHHCRQALEIARSTPLPPIPVTLLVSSEERTLMGTRRASDWISRNFKRVGQFGELAKLQILRAGHLMMFDEPVAVAAAITDVAEGGPR